MQQSIILNNNNWTKNENEFNYSFHYLECFDEDDDLLIIRCSNSRKVEEVITELNDLGFAIKSYDLLDEHEMIYAGFDIDLDTYLETQL